jgi:nitroreductase
MTNEVLRAIRTRRVVRRMTAEPIDREQRITVLNAARWAPSGGKRRLHRFVAVQRAVTRRLRRMVSPGMLQHPTAAVAICVDRLRVAAYRLPSQNTVVEVDVGTALQTMVLAAHAIGLGAGPVMWFSKAAVRVILQLPDHLSPEVLVCLGHPASDGPRPCARVGGSPGSASPIGRSSRRQTRLWPGGQRTVRRMAQRRAGGRPGNQPRHGRHEREATDGLDVTPLWSCPSHDPPEARGSRGGCSHTSKRWLGDPRDWETVGEFRPPGALPTPWPSESEATIDSTVVRPYTSKQWLMSWTCFVRFPETGPTDTPEKCL